MTDVANDVKPATAAPSTSTAKANNNNTPVESPTKREDRLKKNRQKARERRSRKKNLVETIQRNVIVLTRVNNELRKKNQALLAELAELGAPPPPMAIAGANTAAVSDPATQRAALVLGSAPNAATPAPPATMAAPMPPTAATNLVVPNGAVAPAAMGMLANPVALGGMMPVMPPLNLNMVCLLCIVFLNVMC